MASMRVYVASALGFSELSRRQYVQDLLSPLRKLGCTVLDPWEKVLETPQSRLIADSRQLPAEAAIAIGVRNSELIRQADVVLAILDGADVDAGVAAEVGFGAGIGKKIIAYRGDFRPSGDFLTVPVNAQLMAFVSLTGGKVSTTLQEVWDVLRSMS